MTTMDLQSTAKELLARVPINQRVAAAESMLGKVICEALYAEALPAHIAEALREGAWDYLPTNDEEREEVAAMARERDEALQQRKAS